MDAAPRGTTPRMMVTGLLAGLVLPVVVAVPALAHVSISPSEAAEGSTATFTLVVGHDCEGSPTTRVAAETSGAFDRVEPVAIDGWEETVDGGTVSWVADEGAEGSAGDFVFEARVIAAEGSVVPVPVVQECVAGTYRWVQVAEEGQNPGDLAEPAPLLTVVPGTPVATTAATTTPSTTVAEPAATTAAPTTTPSTTTARTTTAAPTTQPPTTVPDTTVAAAPGDEEPGSVLPWVIAGVVVLAAAVGVGIMVRRRREPG